MRTLGRTFRRFEQVFTSDRDEVWRGSIVTATEGVSGLSNFIETRQTLHCRPNEPVRVGAVITDASKRRFLVANHDRTADAAIYKLFLLTSCVSWKRQQREIEPVTGLEKGAFDVELGPIWAAVELYGREEYDRAMHVGMDRSRVLTGSELQLGDKIDDRQVRRLYTVYGVQVAEIQ
jgi:hypothetical protein